jgi:hypothetical protein
MSQYELNAIWPQIAADPIAKKALRARFSRDSEIDKKIADGDNTEIEGEYLSDLLCDLLMNDGRLYKRFTARGSEWNYPIDIRGLGGVYFIGAPEFGVIGYFLSLDEAEKVVISNWSDSLVSPKGRKFRVAFELTRAFLPMTIVKGSDSPRSSESSDTNQEPFVRAISRILSRKISGGLFTEDTEIDGEEVSYGISWSTGIHWLKCQQAYRERFGAIPSWVLQEHPAHRVSLCLLSLKRGAALPEERPCNLECG